MHAGHISRVRLATERLRACRLAPAAASGKKVAEAYRQICFRVLRYMTNARRCCFPLILSRVHGQIFCVRASCIGVLASCPPPFRRRTRQRSARHALGRGRRREGGSEGGALIEPPRQLARIQLDTLVGMGISNIIALFIMITPNSRSFPKSGFGNRATKFLSLPSPFRQCGRTPLVVEVWPVVLTLTAN